MIPNLNVFQKSIYIWKITLIDGIFYKAWNQPIPLNEFTFIKMKNIFILNL